MKRSIVLVFIASLVLLGSCREDSMIDEMELPIPNEVPEFYETDLNGRVTDESGQAVADATVILDGISVQTDQYGFYKASKVLVPETGLYIKALKEGYFVGGTQYNPAIGGTAGAAAAFITLAKYEQTSTFLSSEGVLMDLPDGSSLEIPGNGFARNGLAYDGMVEVNMKWLDPTASETSFLMPGALIGRTVEDDIQLLQTFGMIGVEMTDGSGTEVEIAEGSTAILNFPIPDELAADAPDEIPLWYFDETEGVWVEEGSAEKRGNEYFGTVSHFTWWNCDVPGDYTYLCINFFNESGSPLYYGNFCVEAAGWGTGSGEIYYDNTVCDLAPSGVELTLIMKDDCGEPYHVESLGSFMEGEAEVDVTVTSEPVNTVVTIEGTIQDCNGDPVTDGLVSVETYYGIFSDYLIAGDGTYSVSFNICDPSLNEVVLQGTDLNGLRQSDPITVVLDDPDNVYEENISACENQLDPSMVLIFASGTAVDVENCTARVTPKEILITSDDSANNTIGYIIGVEGFSEGTFEANLLTPTLNLYGDEHDFNVEITEYGDVGGKIVGKFTHQDVSGSFVADRIQ